MFQKKQQSRVISFLSCDPGNYLEQCQMPGIEDIEEILHLPFAPFSIIGKEQGQRQQPVDLDAANGPSQKEQTCAQHGKVNGKLVVLRILKYRSENRNHAAPETIVDDKNLIQKPHPCHCGEKHQCGQGVFLCLPALQGENRQDGQGEGKEDGKVHRSVHKEIHDLAQERQQKNAAEIARFIPGVLAAFRDHEGEDGISQSAEDAKQRHSGKKHQSCMVADHGSGGKDLQGIAGEEAVHGQPSFLWIYYSIRKELCKGVALFLFPRYNGAKTGKKDVFMELERGRPADWEARLDKEKRVYDLLDSLGVEYWRVDHEEAMTMEVCAAIDEVLEATICKNLLLCNRQCTAFYLLMIPGDKVFKTSVLSKQIGSSRLSFADAEYMLRFLDITPGSVSVLGLMNDHEKQVQLLMDKDVLKGEYIGCHPCINTSSLRLRTADLMEKIIPAMGHEPMLVEL